MKYVVCCCVFIQCIIIMLENNIVIAANVCPDSFKYSMMLINTYETGYSYSEAVDAIELAGYERNNSACVTCDNSATGLNGLETRSAFMESDKGVLIYHGHGAWSATEHCYYVQFGVFPDNFSAIEQQDWIDFLSFASDKTALKMYDEEGDLIGYGLPANYLGCNTDEAIVAANMCYFQEMNIDFDGRVAVGGSGVVYTEVIGNYINDMFDHLQRTNYSTISDYCSDLDSLSFVGEGSTTALMPHLLEIAPPFGTNFDQPWNDCSMSFDSEININDCVACPTCDLFVYPVCVMSGYLRDVKLSMDGTSVKYQIGAYQANNTMNVTLDCGIVRGEVDPILWTARRPV